MRVDRSSKFQPPVPESVCNLPVQTEGELPLGSILINLIVILALSTYALALHGGQVEVQHMAIACLWMYPVLQVLILFHELGHAVMARLLSMRLDGIKVGSGTTLGTFRLLGIPVQLGRTPFGGLAHAYAVDPRHMRLKQSLMVAGGPAADLAVLAVAVAFYPDGEAFYEQQTQWPVQAALLLGVVAIVKLSSLFRGLWPQEVWVEGRKTPNDGLLLRRFLLPRGNDLVELHLAQGYMLCQGGHYADARALYLESLSKSQSDKETKTKLLDALACIPIYHDCPEYLAEADTWSREALELLPSSHTLRGTLGSILVLMDKCSEGKTMLQEVYVQSPAALDRSISAAFLALVSAKEGDFKRSEELFDTAKQIDPACVVLGKIRKSIDAQLELTPTAKQPGN